MWKAIVALFGVGHVCAEISLKIQIESGRWLKRNKSGFVGGTVFVVDPNIKGIVSHDQVDGPLDPLADGKMQLIAAATFKKQRWVGDDLPNPVEKYLEKTLNKRGRVQSLPVVSPGVLVAPKNCRVSRMYGGFKCVLPLFFPPYLRIECQGNDGRPVVFRVYEKLPLSSAIRGKTLYQHKMVLHTKTEIAGEGTKRSHLTTVNGDKAAPLHGVLEFSLSPEYRDGIITFVAEPASSDGFAKDASSDGFTEDVTTIASNGWLSAGGLVPFMKVRINPLMFTDNRAVPKRRVVPSEDQQGSPTWRFETTGDETPNVVFHIGGPLYIGPQQSRDQQGSPICRYEARGEEPVNVEPENRVPLLGDY